MKGVLDASALLAYLHREPGWELVHLVISDSCIGTVNWCEVAQKVATKGLDISTVYELLTDLGLAFEPFSSGQAERAAELWTQTRSLGLSLADRACLALALDHNLPAFTADRAWGRLDLDLVINVIR